LGFPEKSWRITTISKIPYPVRKPIERIEESGETQKSVADFSLIFFRPFKKKAG
jgi:hypothetical protein